jgi:hypothetical protein
MFCGLCGRNMVGVSGTKNGRKIPYYVCTGRLAKTGCRMDYIRPTSSRADHLGLLRAL